MAKKVLLIEDDRDLIQLLRFNLEREGYRVRCAMDGGLALAELRRYEPDVLILDLMLPGTDGLEENRCQAAISPISPERSTEGVIRPKLGKW